MKISPEAKVGWEQHLRVDLGPLQTARTFEEGQEVFKAIQATVKRRYHELARAWHPDLHPGDEGNLQKLKELNAGYDAFSKLVFQRPPPVVMRPVMVMYTSVATTGATHWTDNGSGGFRVWRSS